MTQKITSYNNIYELRKHIDEQTKRQTEYNIELYKSKIKQLTLKIKELENHV